MKTILLNFILFLSCNLVAQDGKNEFEELAKAYHHQGKIAQAAEFYSKSGYAYWNKGNKNSAAQMFLQSYELFKSLDNQYAALTVSNNLGIVLLDIEDYAQSYKAFGNSLLHARKMQNIQEEFNALINQASVSIELTNFQDAIQKSLDALSVATETNNLKNLARSYGILAEGYEKLGDAGNAYKYYELYSTIDKKIKAQEIENIKSMSDEEIRKAQEGKRVTEIELKIKKGELKVTQDSLAISERLSYERQMQIEVRNAQLKEKEVELKYERHIRFTLIAGIIFVLLFLLGLFFMFKQKIKDNKLLKAQKEEITQQKDKLDVQNKKITDSIHYGLRIQQAMLPSEEKINKKLETFIIYQPKDIVSGDFYWYYETNIDGKEVQFVAVADCTGHGVPGAFMSMIGNRLISEIVIDKKIHDPSLILDEINNLIRAELNQDNNKSMDGMDIALCCICKNGSIYEKLIFSGAKRNIIYIPESKKPEIIEGDHKSIGGVLSKRVLHFTNKEINVKAGDIVYLYSDGIIDQQNYLRERYGTDRFMELIQKICNNNMKEQKDTILANFLQFKGNEEQRDDVTVFGFKLK